MAEGDKDEAVGISLHRTEDSAPYEPSFDLLQHLIERFVFYSLLFKRDRSDANAELYYAAWNLFPWANDVILVRWGEGMGTTVTPAGKRSFTRRHADHARTKQRAHLSRTRCVPCTSSRDWAQQSLSRVVWLLPIACLLQLPTTDTHSARAGAECRGRSPMLAEIPPPWRSLLCF